MRTSKTGSIRAKGRLVGITVLGAVLFVTACGGSDSSAKSPTGSESPTTGGSTSSAPASTQSSPGSSGDAAQSLPADGCALLADAEVAKFLGSVPTCDPTNNTTAGKEEKGGTWRVPHDNRLPSLSAGISRTMTALDKAVFELDARRFGGPDAEVKILGDLGDDAALSISPSPAKDGYLRILRGRDVIGVSTTESNLSGDALAEALIATGRRLLASYG